MVYITFNDYPGGIYRSQVIDVITYLNHLSHRKVRLIAFVSLRNFLNTRRKIKSAYIHSVVIPMFPGVQSWRWNRLLLFFLILIYRPSLVITRGVFAFHICLPFKKSGFIKKLIFDARGAYKAEFEEYKVIPNNKIINQIKILEEEAIKQADFKIAVSNELVKYWKETYNYISNNHVIIPCTLPNEFTTKPPDEEYILKKRHQLGFNSEDIIIVFSGSTSGWQSLRTSDQLFIQMLQQYDKLKILLLGEHHLNDYHAYHKFPSKIKQTRCSPEEVFNYLCIGDYGWLVREQSITNKVSSPVKFAEYLFAGLEIIISENIGDYSNFCKQHQCGFIIKDSNDIKKLQLKKLPYSRKKELYELALQNFTKDTYKSEYLKIVNLPQQ